MLRLAASASLRGNSTLEHHREGETGPQTCVGSSRFAASELVFPLGDHGLHQPFRAGLWMAVPGQALLQARGLGSLVLLEKTSPASTLCNYISKQVSPQEQAENPTVVSGSQFSY